MFIINCIVAFFRICVEEQILPVAASLPPGYLAIQPLGLGKGVSNDAEPAHEGKGIHVSVRMLQLHCFSCLLLKMPKSQTNF